MQRTIFVRVKNRGIGLFILRVRGSENFDILEHMDGGESAGISSSEPRTLFRCTSKRGVLL